jgi:hypothetical protein
MTLVDLPTRSNEYLRVSRAAAYFCYCTITCACAGRFVHDIQSTFVKLYFWCLRILAVDDDVLSPCSDVGVVRIQEQVSSQTSA